MTVPTHFRRNSDIPGILVLHYADLPDSDVQTAQGFKFTRPLRTILDLIETAPWSSVSSDKLSDKLSSAASSLANR